MDGLRVGMAVVAIPTLGCVSTFNVCKKKNGCFPHDSPFTQLQKR